MTCMSHYVRAERTDIRRRCGRCQGVADADIGSGDRDERGRVQNRQHMIGEVNNTLLAEERQCTADMNGG